VSAASRSSIGTESVPTPSKLGATWRAAFASAGKGFLADDCMGLAQEIAYSALLAFIPTVVFGLGLIGLLGAYGAVESFVDPITPHSVSTLIDTLHRDTSGTSASLLALLLGGLGAVWAASGAMGAVIKGVNRAQGIKETRPFWKARLVAILLVVVSGIAAVGMLALIVIGAPLGRAIADRASLGTAFDIVWGILRWPVAFCVVLVFFGVVYYLAPSRRPRSWRRIAPGSLAGGLLWLALSGLFALYTAFAGSYSRTYGTLATAIVLLLWLNYSGLALLFGAELNAALERRAGFRRP
jgi:membrane protein